MMSRMPERDMRGDANKDRRFSWRPSNAMIAVIFLLIVTIGPYLAFTKHVPFTSYGYELNATFANGVNISKNSPVRIAGVEVGKVIGAERDVIAQVRSAYSSWQASNEIIASTQSAVDAATLSLEGVRAESTTTKS